MIPLTLIFFPFSCDLVASSIVIPRDRTWTNLECHNLPNYDSECPFDRLIDMEVTLEEGLQIVKDNIDKNYRVPPLVITRLYRGGKTTVLKALFQRLKDNRFFPIIISLNGGLELRYPTESPLKVLIRLIAVQFIEVAPNESLKTFVCSEQDLLARLNYLSQVENKRIVLLIDALNRFGAPVDDAVSKFLKVNFLDKKGHYLIFSSHVMVRLQDQMIATQNCKQFINVPPSVRGICTIQLPFCSDNSMLRGMGEEYTGLTDLDVTLGAGIPSLIYAKRQPTEMSIVAIFTSVMEVMVTDNARYLAENRQALMTNFLLELFDGKKRQNLFSCFADIFFNGGNESVRYPLPYVTCIWEWLGDSRLGQLVKTLSHNAREVEGGKDWEVIIVTALVLGFL